MPLFPDHLPYFTLALITENVDDVHQFDIFPSRIQPTPGYSFDDAILSFIATALSPGWANWHTILLDSWHDFAPHGPVFAHPVARVRADAIAHTPYQGPGQHDSAAITVHLAHDRVRINGQSIPRRAFPQTPFFQNNTLSLHSNIHQWTASSPEALSLAVGAIAQHIDMQGHAPLEDILCPLLARHARIHAANNKTGREALSLGHSLGDAITTQLLDSWAVRGNTVIAATHHVASDDFATLAAKLADTPGFHTGAAIARDLLPAIGLDTRCLAGLDRYPASAHQAIKARHLQKRIDTALIAGLPRASLTPMAARQKDRLAQAA